MKPVDTKLLLLWAIVLFVLISAVPAVRADWRPGDPYKMHYPQLPDPEGWDICVVDQHIADDFMCTESGKITDIHIWFSVEYDEPINPEILFADISIWSDGGGQPGMRLWTWDGGGQMNFIAPYGTGMQGWACPSLSIIRPNDHFAYHQVNITEIPEPFEQKEGEIYWLVVRVLEPPQPKVGWKTSADEPPGPTGPIWGSPAMWSGNPDVGEPWQPVETGTVMPQMHDMAFVITGEVKEPPTITVTEWVNPEPWHRWFGPHRMVPVKVIPQDPCDTITKVDFFWSLDGLEWVQFGSDEDGSEPKLTIPNDPEPSEDGDGWAAYLDPAQLPLTAAVTPVHFQARVYDVDSFFDITYQIEFDPSPPDSVEVTTEIQDDILMVDVNPDPRYPTDIQYIVVEVEPKEEEFAKGIPPLDQLDPARQYGGGYHCAPTATAACLKYFESTGDDEIAGGLSGDDLTDELAEYEGCNEGGRGTYFGEWVDGIRDWIADHGDGYTVRSFDNFDWDTARDELERCQDVLLRLQWPGDGGHALTLNSIHNTPEADGTIRIDLMDPYGGTISYGDLDPTSGRLTGFEGASGSTGTFSHMIIICPKEEDPGGGGDPHPGPDPDPIPFPIPDPGKYFVRVTVVDISNHAATLISVVEKKGSDFGDAPEGALAYPSTCKQGSFPTCMNVPIAGWIQHFSSGQLFFGPLVDLEAEGNAGFCPLFNPNTYDQDECFADNDAGLIKPPAYTIQNDATGKASVVPCSGQTGSLGTVCNTAIWGQDIDIHVENRTNQEAYVNVLVDWNKSGEWSGQSVCPACLGGAVAMEHVLVDQRIPAGFSGPLSGAMTVVKSFIIGPNRGYVWTRFTITPNRMGFTDWPGDGEFSDGESEDYLIHVKPAPVQHECDWDPGDPYKMHHPQEPDLTDTGIDVDMFWTPLADDFKCSETGYITDVHFWGSFADDCLPPGGPASLTFQVTIYSDIPATADRHSMPGEPLWTRIVEPCTYSVRRMEDGPEGWYDPVTGLYIPQNHYQAYQYNICINEDEAFRQDEGTIYWLEIKDIVVAPGIEPEYTFGWKTTKIDLGWNDDAVYRSTTGGWAELIYPDGHPYHPASLNLAFVITGEPDPEPDMDWGDAPDPTYPTLAASIGASHIIDPRTYMGATVDMDPDGQPTAAADGDDTDADGDDEDGVTFDTPLIPGQMAQITVDASIAGAFISVWIDFDGDGSWDPVATDYVVQSVMSVAGDNVFPLIPVPPTAIPGTRAYVRVRFTTMPQIPYDGPAPNGEVEDYVVVIKEPYQPKPPVPHLKWSQPPIEIDPVTGRRPTFCGWDEPSWRRLQTTPPYEIYSPMVADDFRCLGRMPITSIHWWGSHYGWVEAGLAPPVQPIAWDISFWRNVPAGGGVSDFSQPGERLWNVCVDDTARVSVETVGRDFFHDMHPTDVCYQYTLYLEPNEYFWQNNHVEQNPDGIVGDTVFWISIQALYSNEAEVAYPWGWKTRPWSWMDDATRRVPVAGGLSGNPVSHWPFEEGQGTTTADIGSGGNHGTLQGDTAWVIDPLEGSCLDFDGTGDYVVTGNTTTGLNFAPNSFSASAWINARAVSDEYRAVVDYDRLGSNWFTIFLHPGGGFHFRVGRDFKNSDRVLNRDEWYLLTGTYDSTNRLMSLYINGQFDCSITQSLGFDAPVSSKVTIAVNGAEDNEYFDGRIDDVRIYDYVLSPDRIQTLFDGCVWEPIEDPLCGESFDLAFELDTDPDYIKWEQPFNGLRHWPHYEDEESMGWQTEAAPTKWQQLPNTAWPGLHCHDSVNGAVTLADDWDCEGGDVTDLHWYGNYELDSQDQEMRGRGIQAFHLSIHDSDPTVPCLPGNEIWGVDVPFASLTEIDTGLLNSEGCKIYLYEYDLLDPFPQIEGNKYWFDISAKSAYPDSPAIWRWQEADRDPTPVLCGAAERNDPFTGMWHTIEWDRSRWVPPEPNWFSDMAFAITSGPKEPRVDIQRLVADDWQCTTMQPVTAAVWWGSYIGYRYTACECLTMPEPVKPSYFHLTIWTDVPAGGDADYSHPGEKVWEYNAYNFDEVLVGFDKHPEDVVPGQPYGREPVFRYSVRLPKDAWFHQEEENGVYWFSAVAVYKEGADPTYMWGWTNHEHVFNDDAVAGSHDPATGEWFWQELYDQTGISEDMSFILFTDPDFCDDCADYNNDGIVNFIDYAYFVDEWLWTGPASAYNDSDLNCDGAVDFKDLKILTEQWLGDCP